MKSSTYEDPLEKKKQGRVAQKKSVHPKPRLLIGALIYREDQAQRAKRSGKENIYAELKRGEVAGTITIIAIVYRVWLPVPLFDVGGRCVDWGMMCLLSQAGEGGGINGKYR